MISFGKNNEEISSYFFEVTTHLSQLERDIQLLSNQINKLSVSLDGIRHLCTSALPSMKADLDKIASSYSEHLSVDSFPERYSSANRTDLLNRNPVSGCDTVSAPVETLYFGCLAGLGFQKGYELKRGLNDSQSLYKLYVHGDTSAEFEPLADRLSRFQSNFSSLLQPVCDVVNGDISSASRIKVVKKGKLKLENGYWKLVEKCEIEC